MANLTIEYLNGNVKVYPVATLKKLLRIIGTHAWGYKKLWMRFEDGTDLELLNHDWGN